MSSHIYTYLHTYACVHTCTYTCATYMHAFGTEDKALYWFETYLRPQSFKVLVNDKYSTEKDLTFSVPQGSCAGAFIFISYSSVLKRLMSREYKSEWIHR